MTIARFEGYIRIRLAVRAATRSAFATVISSDAAGWSTRCGNPANHQAS